jgi:adenine/guanine/hypoxanthine permease
VSKNRYQWAALGDVNAFFGLMLDNVADLLLAVGLLAGVFEFPTDFALAYMVPGTAIGVLVGDLLFFWMAFGLARRSGRTDVTAMPLGLDTPSTFGMVFFVLGPSFLHAKFDLGLNPHEAAAYTWRIGICAIFVSGLFKLACSFGSHWVRTSLPRAGLLGSLAAIALVLISFLPMLEILHYPVVGFAALAVILTTLVARIRFPFHVPGALAGLLVGGAIYYAMVAFDAMTPFDLLGYRAASRVRPSRRPPAHRLVQRISLRVDHGPAGFAGLHADRDPVRPGDGRGRHRLHRERRGRGG